MGNSERDMLASKRFSILSQHYILPSLTLSSIVEQINNACVYNVLKQGLCRFETWKLSKMLIKYTIYHTKFSRGDQNLYDLDSDMLVSTKCYFNTLGFYIVDVSNFIYFFTLRDQSLKKSPSAKCIACTKDAIILYDIDFIIWSKNLFIRQE